MAIDPGTAMLISAIVSGVGGMIGGGSDQERRPFAGRLSPEVTLDQAIQQLQGLSPVFAERARRGVNLRSAYAQQPPTFTGGGLPMPIGVQGMDPALGDRSLLSLPGFDIPNIDPSQAQGVQRFPAGSTGPVMTGRQAVRRDAGPEESGDDLEEARAALNLITPNRRIA